jgi:hypothetical protein
MHAVFSSLMPTIHLPSNHPRESRSSQLENPCHPACVLWPSPPLSAAPAPGAPAPASPGCCGGAPPAGPSSGSAPPAPAPPRPHASAAASGTTTPGCGTWLHTNKTRAHPGRTTVCTRHNHKCQAERNGDGHPKAAVEMSLTPSSPQCKGSRPGTGNLGRHLTLLIGQGRQALIDLCHQLHQKEPRFADGL